MKDRKEGTWRETQSKHKRSTHGMCLSCPSILTIFERQKAELGVTRNFQAKLRSIN